VPRRFGGRDSHSGPRRRWLRALRSGAWSGGGAGFESHRGYEARCRAQRGGVPRRFGGRDLHSGPRRRWLRALRSGAWSGGGAGFESHRHELSRIREHVGGGRMDSVRIVDPAAGERLHLLSARHPTAQQQPRESLCSTSSLWPRRWRCSRLSA